VHVFLQLYVALQKKMKSNLTGVAMETMRAAAPVKLEQIESGLYKEVGVWKEIEELFWASVSVNFFAMQRLKTLVPREADLTLEKVSANFEEKRKENERKALTEK